MNAHLKAIIMAESTKLLAQKIPLIIGSVSPIASGVLLYFRNVIAPHLADPTGQLALATIFALLLIVPLLISAYLWKLPKFKATSFGTHVNIKTGEQFCSTCLLQSKIQAPLFIDTEKAYWRCCVDKSHKRENPDYVLPPNPENKPYPPNYPGY